MSVTFERARHGIARVEPELVHFERRRLQRIARRREAPVVLLREALVEKVDAVEPVGAEVVADEQVAQLQELVVRAEGERVVPLQERVRVVQLDDVLVEALRAENCSVPATTVVLPVRTTVTCGNGGCSNAWSR